MDIRRAALTLSGKIPPHYSKHNRLEFMELLEEIFGIKLEKIEFYWKQANEYEEEFYSLVLDFLYWKAQKDTNERAKFDTFINRLGLEIEDKDKLALWVYKDEADFTKNFLLEFFKKLGYQDVTYTHGKKEYWKDIIMRKMDEFWNWRYLGVQSKVWNVSWKTAGDIDELVWQVSDGFWMKIPSLDAKNKVSMSEFIIITDWFFTENAIEKILEKNKEAAQINNIHFLDRTKIENLLDKMWL